MTFASVALAVKIQHRFSYPKSLYAVHDTLRFFVANKPHAIIVDFFAGSGTTMHAVNLLNAEDGGHRKCIMVTNNEVGEEKEKELTRLGFKPGDEEWEKWGIAKYVNWPRTECTILGKDINGKDLSDDYLTSITETKEVGRKVYQINFASSILSLKQKKAIVSFINKQKSIKIPTIKEDVPFVISDDDAFNASVLFDISEKDSWIDALSANDHITNLFILTQNDSVYRQIKKEVDDSLDKIYETVNVSIPMREGFMSNVKYFKCEWTPRKPEDYLLSNVLSLHVREMIELQNSIEIDNEANVLVLNKTDFRRFIMDKSVSSKIKHLWINQNIILNAEEVRALESKEYKYIPKEFFGQELKEAAE